MSFNYDKYKEKGGSDSFWTSYSDLFLGMSVVFLLLYVTASLRTGTSGIQAQIENKKLAMQVEDLKNQLKMYDSVRKDYLDREASPDEAQQYNELMDKLSLLQEEARDERTKLARQIHEQQTKEKALNEYQQMVRNMINANTLSKTKIKRREVVIDKQDDTIAGQKHDIAKLESEVTLKQKEIQDNQQKIADANKRLDQRLKELKYAYKQKKMSEKSYQSQMAKTKAEAQTQLKQLNSMAQAYQQQLAQTHGQLGQAQRQLQQTQAELEKTTGALQATSGQLGQAKGQIGRLSQDLAKAQADADARREIARRMRKGFAKAGVKADIDDRTGEVVINFGDVYFDSDSAHLKEKMKDILQKAMPEYSKALFGDEKLRDKITSVEIIGFSSPTYQGKYVDPNSLDPQVRKAVDYNMDLSYKRARAIFQHIFDESKMNFSHRKDLLPLIKVTGRSFLAEKTGKTRNPSSKNFCDVHDCQKAQRVIIKFSFDDKK